MVLMNEPFCREGEEKSFVCFSGEGSFIGKPWEKDADEWRPGNTKLIMGWEPSSVSGIEGGFKALGRAEPSLIFWL